MALWPYVQEFKPSKISRYTVWVCDCSYSSGTDDNLNLNGTGWHIPFLSWAAKLRAPGSHMAMLLPVWLSLLCFFFVQVRKPCTDLVTTARKLFRPSLIFQTRWRMYQWRWCDQVTSLCVIFGSSCSCPPAAMFPCSPLVEQCYFRQL